jgi:hypothetical protein
LQRTQFPSGGGSLMTPQNTPSSFTAEMNC